MLSDRVDFKPPLNPLESELPPAETQGVLDLRGLTSGAQGADRRAELVGSLSWLLGQLGQGQSLTLELAHCDVAVDGTALRLGFCEQPQKGAPTSARSGLSLDAMLLSLGVGLRPWRPAPGKEPPGRSMSRVVATPSVTLHGHGGPTMGFVTGEGALPPPHGPVRLPLQSLLLPRLQGAVPAIVAGTAGLVVKVIWCARELEAAQEVAAHWWLERLTGVEGRRWVAEGREGADARDLEARMDGWAAMLRQALEGRRILGCRIRVDGPQSASAQMGALATGLWPGAQLLAQPVEVLGAGLDLADSLDVRGLLEGLVCSRTTPGWSLPRAQGPAAQSASPGLTIGNDGHGPVELSPETLARHVHIVGGTGTGKSSLMRAMIAQEMQAGHGVAVFDPHEDLAAAVLADVPPSRRHEVVLFDPTDDDITPGLNYFEPICGHMDLDASRRANELLDMLGQLYDLNATGGPVFEQHLMSAVQLLLCSGVPGMTLCELPLVYESPTFRKALIARCTRPEIQGFWRRQAEPATGDLSMAAVAPYVTSKLQAFVLHPRLRAILGQSRSTVDFDSLLDRGGILIVNLSRGQLGLRESWLLGMMLLGRLFTTAMQRTSRPRAGRTPFSVYVDEVQTCLSGHVASALSEARKVGLRLVLAHQHLAQLETRSQGSQLLDSVLANAATRVAFRVGATDAARLSPVFAPALGASDLVALADFRAAVHIGDADRGLGGRIMRPESSPDHLGDPRLRPDWARLRLQSLARSGRPRTSVESELALRRQYCEALAGTAHASKAA